MQSIIHNLNMVYYINMEYQKHTKQSAKNGIYQEFYILI